MNKNIVRYGAVALAFSAVMLVPGANAHAATIDEMLEQIQDLMEQIEDLQKQLATVRGDIKEIIRDGLEEGMTDDDIKKVQELLATDPSIYPEGFITGYFGPLTKAALKRFQERHGVLGTGFLDEETRELLEEYLSEAFGDDIPPGLLRAPGIAKKVELRYEFKCEQKGIGIGPLCKALKLKYGQDDDDDEDEDEEDFDVEIEIEDGTTTISFTFDGKDYEVETTSQLQSYVLEAVADELDVDVEDLDSDLKAEIKKELEDALAEADEEEAKDEAEEAMDAAEEAIDDAEEAIDDETGDTTSAEALVEDALDKLDEAEEAYDDEDYAEAEELAEDAENLALQAIDELD